MSESDYALCPNINNRSAQTGDNGEVRNFEPIVRIEVVAMKIVKAKIIHDWIDNQLKIRGIKPNDLVLAGIEKIEGSPTEWLQNKYFEQPPKDALSTNNTHPSEPTADKGEVVGEAKNEIKQCPRCYKPVKFKCPQCGYDKF